MAKKLTEDELKWILSVDATDAQQKVRGLTKDNNKLNTTNKELKQRMIDLIATGKKESEEYKNLSKEVERNNESIGKNNAKIKALQGTMGVSALTMSQLRKQAKDLQRQLDNTSQATHPEEYKKLEQNLVSVKNRMSELKSGGEKTGDALSSSFGKVTTVVKGFLALKIVGYLKDIVSNAIETRKEFAKYEAVLRNTFQSQEKTAKSMAMLKKLAQETPYSLQEITEAYIKMVNRGIIPTEQEIIKLGDLASSQGKSLDQLIEALLDAQTGEFERLKEFGIKANKENDKVKFSFKGVTTEINFTEKAISDYLYSLGTIEGVQGGMAVQMEELEGKYSNFGDTLDALFNTIGKRIEPTAKKTLTWLSKIVDGLRVALGSLDDLKQDIYNEASQNAYDDTQEQVDVMVNRLVKNGMDKKKALERTIDILRKQSSEELAKAEEEQAALEARLLNNIWPSARKNIEQALVQKKADVQRYKSELTALDDKVKSSTPEKTVVSDSEIKKQNAAFKSAMDLKLQQMDNAHAEELAKLKKSKNETSQTEQFYNLEVLHADAKYYSDRLKALDNYQKKTTDPKTLALITKQQTEAQTALLDIQQKREQEIINALKDNRDKRLKIEAQSYQTQQIAFEKALAEKQISQQQYDALILSAESATAETRLKINQDYQSDVAALELSAGTTKAQAVLDANDAVMAADLDASKSRAAQQKALQNLVKDFKSEFKLTTVDEDTEAQMKVLEASYQARKEMAEKEHMDTTELDAAYERAKTQLLQQEEDKRNQIRTQYGLLSMQEQYEIEQEQLKQQYDQGLLEEEEYQKAKNQIKANYLKKSYDAYSDMFSGAINALQEAELANIDAKYDAEIQRAGDNSEEVARLEKEKENKKLAVQKKYANVNFAIKVSEIIANTAVAIMQAFGQLGPIGGAIAAAMLTATGAVQIATANAERKKVMSMTVDGAGASGSASGTRVATGREDGGYIDVKRAQDGKSFNAVLDPDKRGFVDRPTVIVGEGPEGRSQEWVASNDALQNPTVVPFINVLNESQEKGDIRTVDMNQLMRKRLAGFESGGSISTPVPSSVPAKDALTPSTSVVGSDAISKLYDLLIKIDQEGGLKAYIIYSEFQKQQSRLEESRKIGSKS
ncbi:hypothetical protein M1P97_20005 [Parabacteroides sp. GYB001]|uniref:hypothetical protein n=1 Tax=Parabacteroides leei TaxID=2939491 RepID=UPI00201758B8|nr:hypothetical protein [Parabacteroides leei]MCL3853571.1 hypothetical protein [Parabacteroides leei]